MIDFVKYMYILHKASCNCNLWSVKGEAGDFKRKGKRETDAYFEARNDRYR